MTSPARRTEVLHRKLLVQGGIVEDVDGEPMLVGGVTQVEALAALRQMPTSFSLDMTKSEFSTSFGAEMNAAKNARKRARRARR